MLLVQKVVQPNNRNPQYSFFSCRQTRFTCAQSSSNSNNRSGFSLVSLGFFKEMRKLEKFSFLVRTSLVFFFCFRYNNNIFLHSSFYVYHFNQNNIVTFSCISTQILILIITQTKFCDVSNKVFIKFLVRLNRSNILLSFFLLFY